VLLERDPVIMKVANTWLILNEGGGPTDDKPTVTLETPPDPDRSSAFLNIRVADIQQIHTVRRKLRWSHPMRGRTGAGRAESTRNPRPLCWSVRGQFSRDDKRTGMIDDDRRGRYRTLIPSS
jgi:hypothetical protein